MFESLLGPLISGGMSLLGGLFNKKKDNRAHNKAVWKSNQAQVNEANRKEVAWNQAVEKKARAAGDFFMSEAGRLGINPITYLSGGGLSHAFNVATVGLSKPAFSYHIRPEEAYQSTGQTTGETIQGALSSFGSALASSIQQGQQNDFQKELVQMQLNAANRLGTGSRGSAYSVLPHAVYSGSARTTSAGSGGFVGTGNSGSDALHRVPMGPADLLTSFGTLRNLKPVDFDKFEKSLGSTIGEIAGVGSYGPAMLKDKGNQNTLLKAAKEWYDMADEFTGWAVNSAWDNRWGGGPAIRFTPPKRDPGVKPFFSRIAPTPGNSRMMQRELSGGQW